MTASPSIQTTSPFDRAPYTKICWYEHAGVAIVVSRNFIHSTQLTTYPTLIVALQFCLPRDTLNPLLGMKRPALMQLFGELFTRSTSEYSNRIHRLSFFRLPVGPANARVIILCRLHFLCFTPLSNFIAKYARCYFSPARPLTSVLSKLCGMPADTTRVLV